MQSCPPKSKYMNASWYQLNWQVGLSTMEMGVDMKYMTTRLGTLDITGVKYNIGHPVLNVIDYKIVPITRDMDYY